MTTDLIRRCDICRQPVPSAAPVALLRASILGASHASLGHPQPIDVCSAGCATSAINQLWTEATSAPTSGADAREVAKLSAPNHRVAVLHCCQAGEVVR